MSKSRPTQSQMKYLVDLMAKDPLLCAGKFTPTFTQKTAKQKWEIIAEQLNALPGAQKSGDKWKKVSYILSLILKCSIQENIDFLFYELCVAFCLHYDTYTITKLNSYGSLK